MRDAVAAAIDEGLSTARQIVEEYGYNYNTVRRELGALAKSGDIQRIGRGEYAEAPISQRELEEMEFKGPSIKYPEVIKSTYSETRYVHGEKITITVTRFSEFENLGAEGNMAAAADREFPSKSFKQGPVNYGTEKLTDSSLLQQIRNGEIELNNDYVEYEDKVKTP